MIAAAPTIPLTKLIESAEALEALPIEELERLVSLHEAECVKLKGLIDYYTPERSRPSRQALRVLILHMQWLLREVGRRNKAAKADQQKLAEQSLVEARKAKLNLIMLAKDEDRRSIEVFKEVALEVLGSEMYLHLWKLAETRMAGGRIGGAA